MPFMSARFQAQLRIFITYSYHEAKNLQRQNHKMCINLHRFETFIPATAHKLLYYEKDSMPLTSKWPFHEFHDPVKSCEITGAWTAAAAPAAMASSPVSPFATLSTAILESVDVCLRCHVAIEPMFSSETLRRFDVHGWIHITYLSRKAKQFQRSEENCFISYSLRMLMGSNYAVRHSHGKVRDVKDTMRFIV